MSTQKDGSDGGTLGAGQSAGGAYPNPHGTDADTKKGKGARGGQSVRGYFGGGQAGDDTKGGSDHHAAARDAEDNPATYRDHPSQQGPKRDKDSAIRRGVGNKDLEGEALEPGDRVQGSDGRPVTGKP